MGLQGIMASLLSVEEAQKAITGQFNVLPEETIALRHARGRVLSRDIIAQNGLPAFTNSSMDGFAVQAANTYGASRDNPVRLIVIGDIPAGRVADFSVQNGQAARIMTGAPLPPGADAVIPVEYTDASTGADHAVPDVVRLFQAVAVSANLRPQGQDVRPGETVLPVGRRLTPRDIGFLAMLGYGSVPVIRKPKIALLSTGDELTEPGSASQPGKIPDSNSLALATLIEEHGGDVIDLGIACDDADAVRERLDTAAAEGCDLIVTSAGVSVGAFDFVRHVIEEHGGLSFWRVNMRPGKPLAFGRYRDIPLIGLPGNPVSAFVGALVFLIPVLRRMCGLGSSLPARIRARLAEPVESDGRESYLRATAWLKADRWNVRLAGNQSSGNMYAFVLANALLIVPSGVKSLPVEAEVEIWPLTDEIG